MPQRDLLAAVRAAAIDRRAAHEHYLETLHAAIAGGIKPGELADLVRGVDAGAVRELEHVRARRRPVRRVA